MLKGLDIKQTVVGFNSFLARAIEDADYSLGLLGMGADGHTAGILPDSPAVGASQLAIYYRSSDFQRITLTASGLAGLDEVIVFAGGSAKHSQLESLAKTNLDPSEQPIQIIKSVRRWSVYNDVMGETI